MSLNDSNSLVLEPCSERSAEILEQVAISSEEIENTQKLIKAKKLALMFELRKEIQRETALVNAKMGAIEVQMSSVLKVLRKKRNKVDPELGYQLNDLDRSDNIRKKTDVVPFFTKRNSSISSSISSSM